MSYEYLNNYKTSKYSDVSEMYNNFIKDYESLIQNHIQNNYKPYSVTLTFINDLNPHEFKQKVPHLIDRFYSKLCKKLDRTMFNNRPKLSPVMYLFIDKNDKRKNDNTSKVITLDKAHLHGTIMIFESYQDKFERIIDNKKLNNLNNTFKKIKLYGEYECSDLDIRPLTTTKEDLYRHVSYITAFMKNPEYSKYLVDTTSPYSISCFDSKVKGIQCEHNKYVQELVGLNASVNMMNNNQSKNFKKIKRPRNYALKNQ